MSMTDRHRGRTTTLGTSVERVRRWRRGAFARRPATGDGSRVDELSVTALSDLFDDAPFGFAVLDEQGRYRLVNQRLAAVDGIPAADHVGRRPAEVNVGGAVDEDCVARVLRTGTPGRTTSTTLPDPASGAERFVL